MGAGISWGQLQTCPTMYLSRRSTTSAGVKLDRSRSSCKQPGMDRHGRLAR